MASPINVKPKAPPAKEASASEAAPGLEQPAPCTIVIFGAGGDLTKRLVVPALYNLSRTSKLPENFALIGVDLAAGTTESWQKSLRDMLQSFVGSSTAELSIGEIDEKAWKWLAKRMSYVQGDLTKPDLCGELAREFDKTEMTYKTGGSAMFCLEV